MMGMTINVEIADGEAAEAHFDKVFSYFKYVDDTFSTYKEMSEIAKINKGLIKESEYKSMLFRNPTTSSNVQFIRP